MHRTASSTKNYPARDADTTEVENPGFSVSEGTGFPGLEAPLVAKKIALEALSQVRQCSSNPQACVNHQRISCKYRFRFCKSGSAAVAPGPQVTL